MRSIVVVVIFLSLCAAVPETWAAGLEDDLGRNETRVHAEPYPIVAGRTVRETRLVERLERLGYLRVRERPTRPGQYFWGDEVFWIFRREHRAEGRLWGAALVGLELRAPEGTIVAGRDPDGRSLPLLREGRIWLEPEVLAESLEGDRARRAPVRLPDLPEHVWRAVLAAEDARFFDHVGLDARAIARAALANLREGGIVQGGSTITQQLVKNRDLSPERSLGRKASELWRALVLEARYDKDEILESYLNHVYLGHVEGLAIHGIGTAARAWFSKSPRELDLAEAATIAGAIHSPNRLVPLRHAAAARERRDWVLERMEELGWADAGAVRRAQAAAVATRPATPRPAGPPQFLAWVERIAAAAAPARVDDDRGLVVETTLDPWVQEEAEDAVSRHLSRLRSAHPGLRGAGLSAAVVILDATTGEVVAYVGGDPGAGRQGLDRAQARRQPGSTVKPFVLLEAFDRCGEREPLHPATLVADEPLEIELPSRSWSPVNYDRQFLGTVDARTALADSRNVPVVRIARHCGFGATAERFERAGLDLPDTPPPSFTLGAVETTPLELAAAYTTFATPGERLAPLPVRRIEKPSGDLVGHDAPDGRRVARPAAAWLVRQLLESAVEEGTARGVATDALDEVAAKTGTSSDLRDAWLAGHAGSLVGVVWVGLDDGRSLGLTGAQAAAPLWREIMAAAVPARPRRETPRPSGIVERWIDPHSGLLVREGHPSARRESFRSDALPPRNRFWRVDEAVPVIR